MKIALFGQYYQNSTAETVQKVVAFLESKEIEIAFESHFLATLKEKNIGILITDHNVSQTLAITDKTYIMFEGKILKEGSPEELANDEDVRRVYLGENFMYQQI